MELRINLGDDARRGRGHEAACAQSVDNLTREAESAEHGGDDDIDVEHRDDHRR
jgi:hypothetical protein